MSHALKTIEICKKKLMTRDYERVKRAKKTLKTESSLSLGNGIKTNEKQKQIESLRKLSIARELTFRGPAPDMARMH